MATVFVAQKPKPGPQGNTYDVSPATEYGEVQFIFDAYQNPSANPRVSLEQVRLALTKFNPETDHIVLAGGDPYAAVLVGFIICELGLPIKYLRFERLRTRPSVGEEPNTTPAKSSGYYIPVEMPAAAY